MTTIRNGVPRLLMLLALAVWLAPLAHALENEAVQQALTALFQSGKADTGSIAANAGMAKVRGFYAARAFKPVWTRNNGPKGKAKALLSELKISAVHGLSPDFYNVDEIAALMDSSQPAALARLDMLLTGSLIEFGEDLANGRIGALVPGSENAVEPVAMGVTEFIEGAEVAGNLREYAGTLLSADARYVRLIAKLAEFLRIEASGQWPVLAKGGTEIMQGKRDPRLPAIRKMLALTGDLPIVAMNGGEVHDAASAAAVRAFQTRHGIGASGEIDAATLHELQTPLSARIEQIRINLERRRWQNRDLGQDHVYVNLADNSVKLVRGGKAASFHSVATQSGLDLLPTFFGTIAGVEIAADGGNRIRLIVQSPFIDGIVELESPKSLAISDMKGLAMGLMEGNVADGLTLDAMLSSPPASRVVFVKPVQLFVTYVTAWANRDGTVEFRPDKFGRDPKLAGILKLR